jgi:hypothetical protein
MRKNFCILLVILFQIVLSFRILGQDSLQFKEQLSAWVQVSPDSYYTFWPGVRYIPQVNYAVNLPRERLIDFEASVNIAALAGFHGFDEARTDINIDFYRFWARYSSRQSELRAGLQKINFGSAYILRPLSWFDQMDPRDPLQLTNGVWGVLGRYYFLNNANIWLWVLYGNYKTKTWEVAPTNDDYPEIGGRFQHPVPKGEAAFSYHFRIADTEGLGDSIPSYGIIPENRIGVDGKWDLGVGIWYEGAWITKSRDIGTLTNQEYMTIGIDYTFGIGNGLNAVLEQMVAAYDQTPFQFRDPTFFSALSVSYPAGISDNLNAIFYYDWTHSGLYSFVSWEKQFGDLSLYIMGYWNPETTRLPDQTGKGSLYPGKGIRAMVVLNK